jgi:Rrf2 family transcriptional regulator, nitric oxide-sensitive transcriptional repressor
MSRPFRARPVKPRDRIGPLHPISPALDCAASSPGRFPDDPKRGAPMFSQTVEYALRAAIFLAQQAPGACTTAQMADATQVPRAYLSKVLQRLTEQGLVRSQRGSGGGVSLALDPAEIPILAIVNAVDPIARISACPLGIQSHQGRLCPLHERLDKAMAQVELALASTTLAELLADPEGRRPLCETRAPPQFPPP